MEMHLPFQAELLVFLVITALLVPLFSRLRLNPVLGFLFAGVVIGPYGLGRMVVEYPFLEHVVFEDIHGVAMLAEMGVICLLFAIGLELSPQRLWSMRRMVFGLGTAQVVVCGALIAGLALAWGNSVTASVIIGSALALSSTAVVMKILMDKQQFGSPTGQASFSILLMQDLAVVPMIFMIAFLQQGGEQPLAMALATAMGKAVAVIAVLVLFGRFVVRPAMRFIAAGKSGPEFFMAQILLIVICAAWATGEAGLSMALGAFLAGLVLAETEFRNQIEVDIEPFKGLLLGLFFMSVGMGIDVFVVMDNLLWLGLAVLGLFTLKAGVIFGLCRLFGIPVPTALQTGMTLGQGGEFAFVLLGLAMAGQIVDKDVGQFMMMVASLTLVVTPLFFSISEKVVKKLLDRSGQTSEESLSEHAQTTGDHVVIAGFGRTGQAVAEIMEHNQIPYLALDLQTAHLEALRKAGKPVFFGDASHEHVLHKVNAINARAVILAMDDQKASNKAIENIRRNCPNVLIFARARDQAHAEELQKLGVNDVVMETVEMSLQLAGRALQCFDYSAAATNRLLEQERDHYELEGLS